MLENPGDELYFGELYRTILQEAWLPEGSPVWQRVGKSRRGRRPTQQGPGANSPQPSQADIRRCFSLCTANWRQLPWSYPPDHPCYGTATKDFWLDEKINKAIPCSYYDYYMRCCMSYCLVTGCILPEANCYVWDPDSTKEIGFPFRLPIYVIGGTPPYTWTVNDPPFWLTFVITTTTNNSIAIRTDTCGIANIKVTDDCGRVVEGVVTTETVSWPYLPPIWSPTNPQEISPDTTEPIAVEGYAEPYTWEVTGEDFSLAETENAGANNFLIAGPDACGTATITVTDCLGAQVTGKVRSTIGQWDLKSTGVCELSGPGTQIGSASGPTRYYYELIQGAYRQLQTTTYWQTLNYMGPCPGEGNPCLGTCEWYGSLSCVECIGDGVNATVPCHNQPTELLPNRITCWGITELAYYEWGCAP